MPRPYVLVRLSSIRCCCCGVIEDMPPIPVGEAIPGKGPPDGEPPNGPPVFVPRFNDEEYGPEFALKPGTEVPAEYGFAFVGIAFAPSPDALEVARNGFAPPAVGPIEGVEMLVPVGFIPGTIDV